MAQNSCAEAMLTFVAPKCGLPAIRFTQSNKNDKQIALNGIPTLFVPEHQILSKDRTQFKTFLSTLNKNQCYFLRSGQNSGAGHWAILHFREGQGWQIFSTPVNQEMITDANGELIEEGAYKLLGNPDKGTAIWGVYMAHYSISIWEATRARVIDSINYVCGFRQTLSNDEVVCENSGTQLMEACEGQLVENHPYLNVEVNPNPEPESESESYSFTDYDTALDNFFIRIYECESVEGAEYLYNQYFLKPFEKLEGDDLRNNAAVHTITRIKNHPHLIGLQRNFLNRVETYCDNVRIDDNPWLSNDILQICAALSGVVMGGLILGGLIVFPASLLIGALLTTVSTLAIGYKLFDSCNDGEGYRPAAGITFF